MYTAVLKKIFLIKFQKKHFFISILCYAINRYFMVCINLFKEA